MKPKAKLPSILLPNAGENLTTAIERILTVYVDGLPLPDMTERLAGVYCKVLLCMHLTPIQNERLWSVLTVDITDEEQTCRWMVELLKAIEKGLRPGNKLLMMTTSERNEHVDNLEGHFNSLLDIVHMLDFENDFSEFVIELWRKYGLGLEDEMRAANLWPEWPRSGNTPIQMYMANIPIHSLTLVEEGLLKCRTRLKFYNELVKKPNRYKNIQIVSFYESIIEFLRKYYPQDDCRGNDVDIIALLANIFFTPDEPSVDGTEYTSLSTINHLNKCYLSATR